MAPVAQQLHGFSPCRIEAGGEIDLDEGRHRSDYDAAVPPSGLRILLVDSTANAELTRTLARAGHDVLEVTDEQQAKRFLGVFQPDLVLLVTRDPVGCCREAKNLAAEPDANVCTTGDPGCRCHARDRTD
jgi:PleD family two-component response regulator